MKRPRPVIRGKVAVLVDEVLDVAEIADEVLRACWGWFVGPTVELARADTDAVEDYSAEVSSVLLAPNGVVAEELTMQDVLLGGVLGYHVRRLVVDDPVLLGRSLPDYEVSALRVEVPLLGDTGQSHAVLVLDAHNVPPVVVTPSLGIGDKAVSDGRDVPGPQWAVLLRYPLDRLDGLEKFPSILDAFAVDQREAMLPDGLVGVVVSQAQMQHGPTDERHAVSRRAVSTLRISVHEGVLAQAHRGYADTVIPTL